MPSINDNFADAIEVTIPAGGGTYTSPPIANTGNTTEPGEPAVSASADLSEWWEYVPAVSGTATFDTMLSTAITGTDTYMAIWTGSSLATLTLVASDDDSGGQAGGATATSRVVDQPVTAGTPYFVQIGGYGLAQVNVVLRVAGPESATAAAPAFDGGAFDGGAFWITSGTSLSRSVGDTAAASDSVARQVTLTRALTDAAAAADAVSASTARARAVTDAAPATDGVTYAITRSLARAVTDAAPAADSTVRTSAAARSVGDAAPAVDSSTRSTARTRTLTDAAPAADGSARAVTRPRALTESAPATDTVSASTTGQLSRSVGDAAPAADGTARVTTQARTVTDAAPAVDGTGARRALGRLTGDAAAATDLSARALLLSRQTLDSALAADAVTWTFTSGIAPVSVSVAAALQARRVGASLRERTAAGRLKPRAVTAGVRE